MVCEVLAVCLVCVPAPPGVFLPVPYCEPAERADLFPFCCLMRSTFLLLLSAASALNIGTATPLCSACRRRTPVPLAIDSGDGVPKPENGPLVADVWEKHKSVLVQGSTLKTWDLGDETTERVQLSLKSDGRPIDANIELWHTPSYIPAKFRVYTEDGSLRPIHAVIETPKHPKTVAVYNTGPLEFPLEAVVANTGRDKASQSLADVPSQRIQGGKIMSFTYGAEVESVQVLLQTEERNMKAKIELTQGPNQPKQIIEVYATVGGQTPFYAVIATPGAGSTIRVVNQNSVEFPINAWILPYKTKGSSDAPVTMGGGGWL